MHCWPSLLRRGLVHYATGSQLPEWPQEAVVLTLCLARTVLVAVVHLVGDLLVAETEAFEVPAQEALMSRVDGDDRVLLEHILTERPSGILHDRRVVVRNAEIFVLFLPELRLVIRLNVLPDDLDVPITVAA